MNGDAWLLKGSAARLPCDLGTWPQQVPPSFDVGKKERAKHGDWELVTLVAK